MSQQQKGLLISPELSSDRDVYDLLGCELVAEALRAGAETRVRVMGTSMLPALWPGDILVIRALVITPSSGNIVLFLRQGRLFAHRVVRAVGSELITRGDALPDLDPPVRVSEVLGVVAEIVRDGSQPVAARAPSLTQRVAALAVRRSEAVYRLMLRWRNAQKIFGGVYHRNP
jgi:signal peptidase I